MKPPIALTATAIVQALFGIAAIAVVIIEPPMPGWPAWFSYWAGFAAITHVISAFLLWRLSWLGPASFVLLWLGAVVVGHLLLSPEYAHPTLLGSLSQVAVLALYGGVIYFHRAAFAPNNSFKPKPLRGSA